MQVVPAPGNGSTQGHGLAALVFVLDPFASPVKNTEDLKKLFGLTPAEAALAMQLFNFCSLHKAAESVGITYNTARVHLQKICAKTNTSGQLELVKLIAGLVVL